MTTTAPYGTWSSPITAEAISKNATTFAEVLVDPVTSEIYHIENRPSEQGRGVVVNTRTGKAVTASTEWNFRTGVHEYGGSPAIVYGGVVYFSNYGDGRVYQVKEGGDPVPITPDSNKVLRFANFAIHPIHTHLLVAIQEDHTINVPSKVVNTLCLIDARAKTVRTIFAGADFYSCPAFTPDGTKLSWQQWNHPDMSWQKTVIYIAEVALEDQSVGLSLNNQLQVANQVTNQEQEVSVVFPSWASNNTLLFTSDVSGFINPWKYTIGEVPRALFANPVNQDFGSPAWTLNTFPYRVLDKDQKYAVFVAVKDGRDELQIVNLAGGAEPQRIDSPYVVINNLQSLSKDNLEVVFTGTKVDEATAIVKCTFSLVNGSFKAAFDVLRSQPDTSFPKEFISVPQPMTVKGVSGDVYIVFYPPKNPNYSGSSIPGELPPCIQNVHGGPTSIQQQGLSWTRNYFTSRGWAWLDVNYTGSSGYGRAYIDHLNPNWGILDPDDCISAAKEISSAPVNLVDPKRLTIRGGSSGGYAVLCALSFSRDLTAFGAGTSSYGISALKPLAIDTHKFESHYMDKLLGGTLEEVPEIYEERSPVNHASSILSPILLLQGEIDQVVPKAQSDEIYAAIQERGGIVEYKVYPGEGHGWRKESTMIDALEREIAFYNKIFKI